MTARELTMSAVDRARAARVLSVIRHHVGREHAISMFAIAEHTGLAPRDIQAIVKVLVEERGIPIGTGTSKPFGYYVIRNEAELAANYRHFMQRGLSILKHARAFNKASILGPIVGQIEIEIGDQR